MTEMLRLPFDQVKEKLAEIMLAQGLSADEAEQMAHIFTENTCDGVASHGLNRFPSFLTAVQQGVVKPGQEPTTESIFGAIEQWDSHYGIGPINARKAMARAIELSREFGLGCVAMRNNNHWMRGGTYGLQAADAGCIGMCWTNTITLMPPWGGADSRIGNNPLIMCVPHGDSPVLLDMAMSQFSNGKLQVMRRRGQQLPIAGGYNKAGELTKDPDEILQARNSLPIGYWKGSGLTLMLDLIATLLSSGDSTKDISEREIESGVSQVFIAIDIESKLGASYVNGKVEDILQDFISSTPLHEGGEVRYPGQGVMNNRKENLALGIPVEPSLWQEILDIL